MNNTRINYAKLNGMLRTIKADELPRDRWGQILSYHDLIVWFGFNETLNPEELKFMKAKLAELVETQNAIEMMKLPQF